MRCWRIVLGTGAVALAFGLVVHKHETATRRPSSDRPADSDPGSVPSRSTDIPARPIGSTAASAETVQGSATPLPVTRELEPAFKEFHDWARRFWSASAGAEPADLLARGVSLARKRREEMIDLIQADPERALQLAIAESMRRILPPAITALLEEQVSGRGDLEVLCALPAPGHEAEVKPIQRYVTIGDRQL